LGKVADKHNFYNVITSQWETIGDLTIPGGFDGAVLTSNANGNASWQPNVVSVQNIATNDLILSENRPFNLADKSLSIQGGITSIGTGLAGEELRVNGLLNFTNGSEGLGKVLVSDAIGNASWQTLPIQNNSQVEIEQSNNPVIISDPNVGILSSSNEDLF
jgi:hypothetical protein